MAAMLHDVGKIAVPSEILCKEGPLTEEEWVVMRSHTVVGAELVERIDAFAHLAPAVRSSHERIDGTGYPDGVPGDDIPLPARIVFVADAFDAITSDRPYRRAESVQAALSELRRHAGTQFCPLVVSELERIYEEEPLLLTRATVHVLPVAGAYNADVSAHAAFTR